MPGYDPYRVVRQFEETLCDYTGAPYAVAVNSCTMALLLAVKWQLSFNRPMANDLHGGPDTMRTSTEVQIPKRTYVSVPMSIIHAGGRPTFRDEEWRGAYRLQPLPVWDSARWLTKDLWHSVANEKVTAKTGEKIAVLIGGMVCVSFHASKTLGDTQGGAILHDNAKADIWLRRARFDGRSEGMAPKHDRFDMIGWHCYMSPDVAARLLLKLYSLPQHNEPLPTDDYPDLSQMEIFR